MKFTVEIQNVDTLEKRLIVVEKLTAPEAHKEVFINILENNEEIKFIEDEESRLVFVSEKGFYSFN